MDFVWDGIAESNVQLLNVALAQSNKFLVGVFIGNMGAVRQIWASLSSQKYIHIKKERGGNGVVVYPLLGGKYVMLPKKPEKIKPTEQVLCVIAHESIISGKFDAGEQNSYWILENPDMSEDENNSRNMRLFYAYLLDRVPFPVFHWWSGKIWESLKSSHRIVNLADLDRGYPDYRPLTNGFKCWQITATPEEITQTIQNLIKRGIISLSSSESKSY